MSENETPYILVSQFRSAGSEQRAKAKHLIAELGHVRWWEFKRRSRLEKQITALLADARMYDLVASNAPPEYQP